MKKKLLLVVVCLPLSLSAQNTYKIEYISKMTPNEETWINTESNVPIAKQRQEMEQTFSEEKRFDLIIEGSESNYYHVFKIDNSQFTEESPYQMGTETRKLITYVNTDTGEVLKEAYAGMEKQKKYRIKYPTEKLAWKLTDETQDICGYPTQKVEYEDKKMNAQVIEWVTSEIEGNHAPGDSWNPYGTVLKKEYNYRDADRPIDQMSWICKEVVVNPKEKVEIPSDGDVISPEEYQKKLAEDVRKIEEIKEFYQESEGLDTDES